MRIYGDFDWVQMFYEGMLVKLVVFVLNLFFDRYYLVYGKMKKVEKVNIISVWLVNLEYYKI